MDKTCLAPAVCHVVKERMLHNDDVGGEGSDVQESYQQKVATMAEAPLKAWYGVTELT